MKKFLSFVLIFLFVFAFIRIATSIYENISRKHDVQVSETKRITEKEAEMLCLAIMGEKDESTGFPFSFGTVKTIEQNGKEYYAIRASWLVNNSHMSYIGDFFVSVDGKEVYTGTVRGEEFEFEDLIWPKA